MIDRIRTWAAAMVCALYWGTGGTLVLIIALVLGPILPAHLARRVGGFFIRWPFRGFINILRWTGVARCEFVGFEKLRFQRGGFILAPNHPAVWDAVFILSEVPHLTCILKSALLCNPLLAAGARLARFIPNDPPQEMIRRSIATLEQGGRLLLFPEGTRTRKTQGPLNEFRGGVAIIARQAKVPVIPVFVETDSDFGMKGHPIWRPEYRLITLRMTVGEPMTCDEGETSHQFLDRLRAAYLSALSRPPE
jgi:1-acyl-sn-glycerol-3-phosphate acyltransferase